ncbi:SulP family inorganic anion transporter [bacterium]|nr:SulP family inorganic anion transporter [bacterium]
MRPQRVDPGPDDRLYPPPRPRPGDLIAGLSVTLILIPQSLAYAELAGLPSYYGLFAAALPPIFAALAASSPYLQTGPVAMTALLSFGALSTLAEPGSPEYLGMAALLAMVVGLTRLLIGLGGAGVISYFMSQPVLIGFTSGAAILVVSSQIPTALGAATPEGKILYRAGWSLFHPGSWDIPSLVLALGVIVAVVVARRVHPLIPGVLIAVIAGLIVGNVMDFSGPQIGEVPTGFPPIGLGLPWSRLPDLFLPGVVIALVGFAEASAISRTFAVQDRSGWDADREFIGQGLANIASAISGSFPVGGSFSRSSINRSSGAKTRWSGAVTGVGVLIFLPFAGVLEPLPRSVLAGIVIAAVASLIRPDQIYRVFKYSPAQGAVSAATFALVLLLAPRIDQAVLLGVGMSTAVHLVRELGVRVESRFIDGTLRLSPGGVLFFGSQQILTEQFLFHLNGNPDAKVLEIDLDGVGRIDYTSAVVLKSLADDARIAGLSVRLMNVPRSARRIMNSVWLDEPPGMAGVRPLLRRRRRDD